jgi:DNA segregation ATPase FtsK/SpoIIIE, S-DNA-T family
MQNIVLGIACTNTPEQAKNFLIDPKLGVDYFAFEGMPHLKDGIIDDQNKAAEKLEELVGEMNRRYTVLKANATRNKSINPDTERPCRDCFSNSQTNSLPLSVSQSQAVLSF